MNELTLEEQHVIGERLLSEGWNARQIATANQPGSRWSLKSPNQRVRLEMAYDLAGTYAELSATNLLDYPRTDPLWRVMVHEGSPEIVLAAARTAEYAEDAVSVAASRRTLSKALRKAGWSASANRVMVTVSPFVQWKSPDGRHKLESLLVSRDDAGGYELSGPGVLIDARPETPPTVLADMALAIGAWRESDEIGGQR